ncbi:MAG: nucleotidyltransferase family protein, partial [Armatimonadota bacterium]
RSDLQPAAESLAAVGYVQEPDDLAPGFSQEFLGECSFVKAGPRVCRLDLHHKLYVFGEARHENDHVWDRSQPVPNALQTVRALSLEDEVHYLAYHLAFHHRGEGVRWFADLARLVQQCHDRLDWDALLNMTARCATGLALHTALEGAHALGAPVPNCVLRALSGYRPPFGERIFYALVSDSKFTWHARTLAVLPSIPGIRPKLTYLRAKLFPAPAHAGKAYSPDGTYRRTTALLRMISIAANCLRGIAMTARALLRPYRDTNGFPFTRKR